MPTGRIPFATLLAPALLALAGCKPPPPPQQAAPPPPAVTVSRPVTREMPEYREYTGRLDTVETVEIRARIRGFLRSIHFREGVEVRKGELLYEIDPSEFQADVTKAEAEVKRLQAQLRLADSEAQRATELHGTSAISTEEYTQKVVTRDTTQAQLLQAQAALRSAKLTLGYTEIRAPIDGRVSRTLITEGNLVGYSEPTLLTTIVRMDKLYVYFDVPETDLLEQERLAREQGLARTADAHVPCYIGLGDESGFSYQRDGAVIAGSSVGLLGSPFAPGTLTATSALFPGRVLQGTLNFRENRVDWTTGTVTLRGVLGNPYRRLVPGLFARVRVPFGKPRQRLLVPEVALSADQRGRFLLVVQPDNKVDYRPVATGDHHGELIEITQGLRPDERVIVKGLQRARPGAEVAPEEVPPGMTSAPGASPKP